MALKPYPSTPAGNGLMFTGGSASFDERTGTNRSPAATAKIVARTQQSAIKPPVARTPVTPPAPGAAFNKYAAGAKHYGTGRNAPNVGITPNKTGYAQRDAQAAARKAALLRRSSGGMK